MTRRKRVIVPGEFYHVILRGVDGRVIFHDLSDFWRFYLFMQFAAEVGTFHIHGFCLMSNHVHLILQPEEHQLATGIHRLAFRYAQRYNKKYERQGHLFQSRYKAIYVQDGNYLRCLIRYIHRNPVRAQMVKYPSDYRFSSHSVYSGHSKLPWLKTDHILSLFGPTHVKALKAFHTYVNVNDAEAKEELYTIRRSLQTGVLGDEEVMESYQKIFDQSDSDQNFSSVTCNFEEVISAVEKMTAVTLDEMQSSSRFQHNVHARAILVKLALDFKLRNIDQLAHMLNRNHSVISRLVHKANKTPALRTAVQAVMQKLGAWPLKSA